MTGTGSGDEQGPGAVAVQMRAEEQSLAHVASFLPAYLSCSAKLALRFPNRQSASSEPRVSPLPPNHAILHQHRQLIPPCSSSRCRWDCLRVSSKDCEGSSLSTTVSQSNGCWIHSSKACRPRYDGSRMTSMRTTRGSEASCGSTAM